MSEIVKTQNDFKVIKLSYDEMKTIGWGINDGYICMKCGQKHSEDGYYIAGLNDILCPYCYPKWIKNATHYKDDIPVETKNFEAAKRKLYV